MLTHHVVLDFTCMLTRHVVLETSHVKKMFLTFALLLTAEASLGEAAAAFRKEEHTIFALSFIFLYSKILPLC